MRRSAFVSLITWMFCFVTTICHGYVSKTRLSAVEVWRNDSEDGEIQMTHGINSWPALLEQLNDPVLERRAIIEGDVLLYQQRKHRNRAIPLMSAPLKVAHRITFKEWLKEAAKLRKVIKINVRSTATIRPVLQYLFASSDQITSPVVLHANVFRTPMSKEAPVDAIEFIDGVKKYFPEATLSIGWTNSNVSELTIPQIDIGWRELFQVLALIKDVEQPLMLAVRLSSAARSSEQIGFILGVRPTISALVWSDDTDVVNDWSEIISLRSGPYSKRLVFDLQAKHRSVLKLLPYVIDTGESKFDRNKWSFVEFPPASAESSGAVLSDEGIAYLGWPTAFLISLQQPPIFPDLQRVTAKLIFVKRKRNIDDDWLKHSGFALYLLEKVFDLQTPEITSGIKVFVGYSGRISIENRGMKYNHYNMKAAGQVRSGGDCYDMELTDKGWQVELKVTGNNCRGEQIASPTTITLETPLPKTKHLRNIIVSKTGDSDLDLVVRDLTHDSSNRPQFMICLLAVCVFRMFFLVNFP